MEENSKSRDFKIGNVLFRSIDRGERQKMAPAKNPWSGSTSLDPSTGVLSAVSSYYTGSACTHHTLTLLAVQAWALFRLGQKKKTTRTWLRILRVLVAVRLLLCTLIKAPLSRWPNTTEYKLEPPKTRQLAHPLALFAIHISSGFC